jgi:cyclic pyranopterin phosphate synthase
MQSVPLLDSFGRVATDLRVSLTDRCSLRCGYCMPAEGLPWISGEVLLSDDEVVRLIRIGIERLGITEVRLTGGEPLLRPGLTGIIKDIAALDPRTRIALTTIGFGLDSLVASC